MNSIILYYCSDENVIRDEDSNIIFDIYRFISPNDLFMLRNGVVHSLISLGNQRTIYDNLYNNVFKIVRR